MSWIEDRTGKFYIRIEAERHLVSRRSAYQQIDVYQTEQFGNVLVLDSHIQTTESDEFFYHEMLVHPAMYAHRSPRKVLIVGGGDGGALEEVLKHKPELAVMVEIDPMVVEVSREHLAGINRGSFDAPNARVLFEDAFTFLQETTEEFDVIIVDCPDPVGAAEVLYTSDFYTLVRKRLRPEGIVAVQTESPIMQMAIHQRALAAIAGAFEHVAVYLGTVPIYPCSIWSFALASLVPDGHRQARNAKLTDLRYYQPEQHDHYFALPPWYYEEERRA